MKCGVCGTKVDFLDIFHWTFKQYDYLCDDCFAWWNALSRQAESRVS